MFRYMIHLGLKFVYGVKRRGPLAHGCIVVPGLFVEKITLIECFGTLVKNQWIIHTIGLFLDSQFYFIFPQSMFIFMSASHCLGYYSSVVKFWNRLSVSLPTLFKIVLAFVFSIESYRFVNFCKQGSWDFDRNCSNSVNQFGEHFHFNNVVFQSMNNVFPYYLVI